MFFKLFICTLLVNGIHSIEEFTCEHENLNISCPNETFIHIINATYGRQNSTICPQKGLDKNTNCSTSNATEIVKQRCEYKTNCSLSASNNIFTDPCVGTFKYLHVTYTCNRRCGYLQCGPNSECVKCGPSCFSASNYCNSETPRPIIGIGPVCLTCCKCKPGYLKDAKTGRCIEKAFCPQQGEQCKTNEVFSECGARCQRTCTNQNPCCDNVPCTSGYVCAENFVRDTVTQKCVYPFQCHGPITL